MLVITSDRLVIHFIWFDWPTIYAACLPWDLGLFVKSTPFFYPKISSDYSIIIIPDSTGCLFLNYYIRQDKVKKT